MPAFVIRQEIEITSSRRYVARYRSRRRSRACFGIEGAHATPPSRRARPPTARRRVADAMQPRHGLMIFDAPRGSQRFTPVSYCCRFLYLCAGMQRRLYAPGARAVTRASRPAPARRHSYHMRSSRPLVAALFSPERCRQFRLRHFLPPSHAMPTCQMSYRLDRALVLGARVCYVG